MLLRHQFTSIKDIDDSLSTAGITHAAEALGVGRRCLHIGCGVLEIPKVNRSLLSGDLCIGPGAGWHGENILREGCPSGIVQECTGIVNDGHGCDGGKVHKFKRLEKVLR